MSNWSTSHNLHDGYSGVALDGYLATGNVVSQPVLVRSGDVFSWITTWTGSGVGTFQIQICNKRERQYPSLEALVSTDNPATWNWAPLADNTGAITFSTSLGSPITFLSTTLGVISWRWMRLVYVRSSGSITLTVESTIKSINT